MIGFLKQTMVLLLAGILAVTGVGPVAQTTPEATQTQTTAATELRAMWVSSVYNLDYPAKATTDPATLKKEADEILKGCVDMGMNAVFLQVRPSADALYPSALFPWSKYLTGASGTAPKGGFDPLAYWVERAHALGLELHAWINPFRVTKGGAKEFAALSPSSPAVLHPEWTVVHKENYYLNPGLPEVRELVVQGTEELARNYDVDGIHLDDYFYPGSDFNDGAAYTQYGKGFANVGDWRRDNVNQLIKTLGERLHAIKPELSYGISPSGVWADKKSQPEGSNTTGGYESYYATYADSRKWVKEGWIDYICPQIYWVIGNKTMDYATIARWWADTVRGTGVRLYIGMADYQAGNKDAGAAWAGTTAIEGQLALNDTLPEVSGEAHFRYKLMAANPALTALYRKVYAAPVPTPTPTPTPLPPQVVEPLWLNQKEHNGYIEGAGGLFRPNAPLSRGEAVALLARLTVDEQGKALYTGAAYVGGFSDVTKDAWYAPYVAFAKTYGVSRGYPDGTFRPDAPVSRAELVKLLSAYVTLPDGQGSGGFSDVAATHWAAAQIGYAAGAGWVAGYPNGTFRPEQSVTRGEAVKMLNRALLRQADTAYLAGAGEINPFADIGTDHWAYYEILEASVTHGFVAGGQGEVWE